MMNLMKGLVKKSKGNKGFSLIELIVVIAIIAILALILVPRFGGFTGEAKKAANDATIKTIETAVIALMSNGKITGLNGKINIPDYNAATNTITIDVTGVSTNPISCTTSIDTELKALIGTKYDNQNGDGFTVTISNGNVTCVAN